MGKNITPSVVMIDGDKVIVGASAKNNMYARPNNVVDEVKRHIGTDKKYMIDGKEHTPTTISSLILKKIKEDVELFLIQRLLLQLLLYQQTLVIIKEKKH